MLRIFVKVWTVFIFCMFISTYHETYVVYNLYIMFIPIQVEKKKASEKQRRDTLNEEYLDLVEKQRLYYKTVKDFTEVCIQYLVYC